MVSVSNRRNNRVTTNNSKKGYSSGVDFLTSIKIHPDEELDNGIKLVYSKEISPTSFPNTRLELLSNAFQMYKFSRFSVRFKSLLPTVVNGLYIAYIDTDPTEQILPTTRDDLLRLIKSHQGAVQGNLQDSWMTRLPIRNDDQFFFIGNKGDVRFRKMGKLYVYQVGSATRFNGLTIDKPMDSGTLTMNWEVEFQSPQLQSLSRVYDGVTQKDILRIFSNLSFYRLWTYSILPAAQIGTTKYRQINQTLGEDLFHEGIGSYYIQKVPTLITIPTTVAAFHSIALPHSYGKYRFPGTDFYTLLTDGTFTQDDLSAWIEKAFGLVSGGIEVAKTLYDVITMISPLFAYNTKAKAILPKRDYRPELTEDKTITVGPSPFPGTPCIYSKSKTNSRIKRIYDEDDEKQLEQLKQLKSKLLLEDYNKLLSDYNDDNFVPKLEKHKPKTTTFLEPIPTGGTVVHWDGRNKPLIQTLIEFTDSTAAADPGVTVTLSQLYMAFKLEDSSNDLEIVDSATPSLPN